MAVVHAAETLCARACNHVAAYRAQIGDVLLAAAFVSYAGPFNTTLRHQLVEQKWRPDLIERCIPLSDGIKPLDLLTGVRLRCKARACTLAQTAAAAAHARVCVFGC